MPIRRVQFGALLAALAASAWLPTSAQAAHPPTPPPCAADGACYPNRLTWGYYPTSWRAWPGDQAGVQPTPDGVAPLPPVEDDLRGLEEPLPHKEIQSGPNPLQEESAEESDAGAAEPAEPSALPAVDPLGLRHPEVESLLIQPAAANVELATAPQQQLAELPPMPRGVPADIRVVPPARPAPPVLPPEPAAPQPTGPNVESDDPPPALPNILRRVAAVRNRGQQAPTLRVRQDQQVRPTAHQATPEGIRVVSPVGALAPTPNEDGLQQAIYFEATDADAADTTGR